MSIRPPMRCFEVRQNIRLDRLHTAIQETAGWSDSYLYEFRIRGNWLWYSGHGMPRGCTPVVRLTSLEFEVGGRRYGLPLDDDFGLKKISNASTARLTRLRDNAISEFLYTYDMGDNCEHRIKVVGLFDMQKGTRLPAFIDGKWKARPRMSAELLASEYSWQPSPIQPMKSMTISLNVLGSLSNATTS